jgi:alpha-1,2-mannosyltransferase
MSAFVRMLLDQLKSGAWLDRRRVLAYSGILLSVELLAFIFIAAGTHGLVVPLSKPATTDFVSFYAAGSLADAGTPELTYDQAAHHAAEERATEPGISYLFFFYPPIFILLCAALARLPYVAAFVGFEFATLVPYLLVMRRTLREKTWVVLLPLLAFPSVLWNIGLGQNAFLTASIFAAAMMIIDRRPVVAGLLLGALCYKPHFGLLIPVAFVAGQHWRAFVAAAVSVLVFFGLSVAAFGWQVWRVFLTAMAGSHVTYESGKVDFAGFVNPFGAIRLLGGSPSTAYIVQTLAVLAMAGLVALVWRRDLSLPTRVATLAAATLVAMPVVLFYDLMLAAVAGAWLVRAGRETGFLPWEKMTLAVLFIIPMLSRSIGIAWHLPIGPLATAVLVVCAGRRASHEMAQQKLDLAVSSQ